MDDFQDVRELFEAFARKELGDLFTEFLAQSSAELLAFDGLCFTGTSVRADDVGYIVPDKLVVGDGFHIVISFGISHWKSGFT